MEVSWVYWRCVSLCGKPKRDEHAQLALLDAMVFFAVCAVICGTLMSYVVSQAGGPSDTVGAGVDPDESLAVLLDSSLGEGFVLDGLGLELTGREQLGETLLLISAMVAQGHPVEVFEPVLSHVGVVLSLVCDPCAALLRTSMAGGAEWVTLMEIGQGPTGTADTDAASQSLGMCEGVPVMVTLVLSPALLSQGLFV